jgi:hypothetical protein
MWQTKTFKTRAAMQRFIDVYGHRMTWNEIFINNGYGIEYQMLTIININ